MITIVSTKILSKKHISNFSKNNIKVLNYGFIKIKSINFSSNLIYKNIIFTSKNAVKSVLQLNKISIKTPVFCVGKKTKNLLEKNNFNVVLYKDYAKDLGVEIVKNHKNNSFTFFCGNLRKETLPNKLKEHNITFNEIKVYETLLKPHIIKEPANAILFFSPSAVESYLILNTIKNEVCFCIGKTTAQVLENKKIKNIIIAKKPSVENVINKVINYYNN